MTLLGFLGISKTPLVLYTGSAFWSTHPEIRPAKKGRAEHGPGIYFTTHLSTARKYAKGRGTVLRVEIDRSIVWLEGQVVPTSVLTDWLSGQRGLRYKKEIIADLESKGSRGLPAGMCRVSNLVNLWVNYGIVGAHGPELAKFLVSLGIGASYSKESGTEEWVVIFDPSKVLSWTRVPSASSDWELPSVKL